MYLYKKYFNMLLNSCQDNITQSQIIRLAKQELERVAPDVKITVESLKKLPENKGVGYFFKVNFPQVNSYRYWIEWTEDLGAWIERDGMQATITIRESRLNDTKPIESSLITCLSSHVAATCLCLQGQIAIHANVVALDKSSSAIAFAGDSGRGKSTLTAYCASKGANFITDDVLILDELGVARPGTSRIKLFPSLAAELGLNATLESDYKIHYSPQELGAAIATKPLPVRVLYILEESSDLSIYTETLTLGEAITHLIRHSYHTSVIMKDNPFLFEQYIDLAQHITVKRLFYPRQLELLPAVYEYLIQDR